MRELPTARPLRIAERGCGGRRLPLGCDHPAFVWAPWIAFWVGWVDWGAAQCLRDGSHPPHHDIWPYTKGYARRPPKQGAERTRQSAYRRMEQRAALDWGDGRHVHIKLYKGCSGAVVGEGLTAHPPNSPPPPLRHRRTHPNRRHRYRSGLPQPRCGTCRRGR